MLRIIKVTGNSLSPFFLPGDYVIVGRISLRKKGFIPGDIIVFDHPIQGLLIKKVTSFDNSNQTYQVAGTHPQSSNSSSLGDIHHHDILGKVIWHIKKSRTKP